MPNFQNSIIYMLKAKDESIKKIYIGSTTNMRTRKNEHKSKCCNPNNKSYNYPVYKFIRDNGGWYEWNMIKIKDYKCNLKCELEAEEDKEVLKYGYDNCLNAQRPTRSKKQWGEDNKDKIIEQQKQYYEDNKEQLKEQHKQYYEQNKEKIAEKSRERGKQKMTCDCGSTFRKADKSKHYKTKKHIQFVNSK